MPTLWECRQMVNQIPEPPTSIRDLIGVNNELAEMLVNNDHLMNLYPEFFDINK